MIEQQWTRWAEQRPDRPKIAYRWRLPAMLICGKMLVPEWTEKLSLVGMGYVENQLWPSNTSNWDGYRRTVPAGLEWRLATEDETVADGRGDFKELPIWYGLDLLPDPWTGEPPRLDYSGRYICAPCFKVEHLILYSSFGVSHWRDADAMQRKWNNRTEAQA